MKRLFTIFTILATSIATFCLLGGLQSTSASEEYQSLWSEKNAPYFYGTTKMILQKGTDFNPQAYATQRLFAKDFEDGDLTSKIQITSNNVDPNTPGNYEIHYQVTDSHHNTTQKTVPVEIVDNAEGNYYEKTLYSMPNLGYTTVTGPRGVGQDRQAMGFVLPAGETIDVKLVQGSGKIQARLYDDTANFGEISGTGLNRNLTAAYQSMSYKTTSALFIETPVYSAWPNIPDVIVGIRTPKDSQIFRMPYYHYGDDEAKFRADWAAILAAHPSYLGIVESDAIQFVLETADNQPTTEFKNFGTIDAGLDFFDKLMAEYDALLGYEYDAKQPWNQNFRTKFYVRSASCSALAFYSGASITYCNSNTGRGFASGWAAIHEIAHTYQGAGLKDDKGMALLEVSNNILGHYVQTNDASSIKSLIGGDWLGDVASAYATLETDRDAKGTTFRSLGVKQKLAVIANYLYQHGYKETYAELARLTREMSYKGLFTGDNTSLAGRYALAVYNLTGQDTSAYWSAWGETIPDSILERLHTSPEKPSEDPEDPENPDDPTENPSENPSETPSDGPEDPSEPETPDDPTDDPNTPSDPSDEPTDHPSDQPDTPTTDPAGPTEVPTEPIEVTGVGTPTEDPLPTKPNQPIEVTGISPVEVIGSAGLTADAPELVIATTTTDTPDTKSPDAPTNPLPATDYEPATPAADTPKSSDASGFTPLHYTIFGLFTLLVILIARLIIKNKK